MRAPRPWRCLAPQGGQRGPAAPPGQGQPPAGAGVPPDAEPGPGVREQPQVPALAPLDRSGLLPCPCVSRMGLWVRTHGCPLCPRLRSAHDAEAERALLVPTRLGAMSTRRLAVPFLRHKPTWCGKLCGATPLRWVAACLF